MTAQERTRRATWLLLIGGIALAIVTLVSLVDAAQASAACVERAKVELISCVQPPATWHFGLSIGTGLLLGFLAVKRRLAASP